MRLRSIAVALVVGLALTVTGCGGADDIAPDGDVEQDVAMETSELKSEQATESSSADAGSQVVSDRELYIQVGNAMLTARLENNSSAEALADLLADGPLTLDLHDYGNFEKVGPLLQSLPTNDEQITTEPGDIILYQGDQISIYYDVNTWSFTRLAHIDDMSGEELRDILGEGDVTVTLSLVV